MPHVIQFTAQRFGRVHKASGLTDGFPDMESSLPQRKARTRRWLITAFLIYGAMIAGLLGFVVVFSSDDTHETAAENTATVAATKPARFEAVIANWNRYRNKDARADAR
ncbi:hypothetical protein CQ14_22700 [Bradyrhizobium lablabi]|uniref:Uncharacterized protein n=1 Tax=Bradyrhizobium lablabi TaxID=722472 RepID=A0A0R3N2Z5_9BRAD|nr:hypothetical protein [Bradyrhizobium lablabi]KRR23846.1 hypothetical protein CQ14_22700 [Bradyrhizobium lablabi]